MINKPGILAIVIPLPRGNKFPLIQNPFIKRGYIIPPERIDLLSAKINSSFATVDFQKKLAMDVSDNGNGSNIIYFEHIPPLNHWVGDKIKVAVFATGPKPFIRSFNLNGQELCGTPVTALPIRYNEYLYASATRPHIINLTAEGKVCSIIMGMHVSPKDFCRIIRPVFMASE